MFAFLLGDPTTITLPIEPFISLGTPIIVATITGFFGLAGIWLTKRLNKIERLAAPTGNGFAKSTTDNLDAVLDAVREIKRDVGGLRQDVRATTGRLDHLTTRFDDHIKEK